MKVRERENSSFLFLLSWASHELSLMALKHQEMHKKDSEPKAQTINLNSLNTRSNQSAGDGTEKQINSETDPISS